MANAKRIRINGITYDLGGNSTKVNVGDTISIGQININVGNTVTSGTGYFFLPYEVDESVGSVTATATYFRGNGTSKSSPKVTVEMLNILEGDKRRLRFTVSETVTKYMVYYLTGLEITFGGDVPTPTSEEDEL